MLKKICVVVSLLLLIIPLIAKSNEVFFSFQVSSKKEINKLSGLISIDKINGNTVYAYANREQLTQFDQLNYSYNIIQQPDRSNNPMADTLQKMRSWDSYPTYETYIDLMYQFAADHPNICTISSIGQSIEGRDILVANISDNPGIEEDEPEFFYTGQMHGNELVAFIMLLHLIDYLTENYGSNDRITNIVDNIDIYINPLSNPDGTYAGGNNTVWNATRNNANSIDLNRNYPDPEDGPHPDGNEWQPETLIMMDYADEQNFVLSSNLHSGIELLNYPWDTWEQLAADDQWWQDVCHTYADTVHLYAPAGYMDEFDNGVTNGFQWFSMNGGRQDYMNYFQHCREMTLELSNQKDLPEAQLEPHWNYNRQSFLLYMEECLYGLRGIVTNTSSDPLWAEVTMVNHDIDNSEVFTDPDVGNYHRMLAPGTYEAKYNAWGYFPQTVPNIQIFENDIVVQNIQLESSPQFTITGIVTNFFNSDPVEDVTVELLETPLDAVITNENGEFEIIGVYEDIYEVKLTVDGFSTTTIEICVNEQSTIFNLELLECDTENFETGDYSSFPWAFSGDADWVIDNVNAFGGTFSARSGNISDNESSGLSISMTTSYDGNIAFYNKLSSEGGFDYLTFYVDDVMIAHWAGESEWEYYDYFVEAGFHTFKWEYDKDNGVSTGNDCGWLDHISFPPTAVVHASIINNLPKIELVGNFPNPFNPQTAIMFQLSKQMPVELYVYNVKGQKIKTLLKEEKEAGMHSIVWNGNDDNNSSVASGVYFYRMITEEVIESKKMLLLK